MRNFFRQKLYERDLASDGGHLAIVRVPLLLGQRNNASGKGPPDMDDTFELASRYCGPPQSGNGGYFCGRIADHFGGPVAIRLKAPPPLEVPLVIEREDTRAKVLHGTQVIAEVSSKGTAPAPVAYLPLSEVQTISAQGLIASKINHPFPTCFVCGPDRKHQDGMRIFTGPNQEKTLYAAHWSADLCWSTDSKHIDHRFIWAAMDCPSSGPAFATALEPQSTIAYVLGTLEVHIERPVPAGRDYVVTSVLDEDTGKLYRTRVSLYGEDGVHYASGRAVWVQVPRSLFQ